MSYKIKFGENFSMKKIIIDRTLQCRYCLGYGSSDKSYSTTWGHVENSHLVFYYHKKWKCYIVWNASILKQADRNSESANFSYGEELICRIKQGIPPNIESFDKRILYQGKQDHYEKVVLVPENKIFDFCICYEDYIYPSPEDLKSRAYLFALPNDDNVVELNAKVDSYGKVIRERDRISRARRNPYFRDLILKKYNSTCIICGCQEEIILEAAHIKGVAEGGDDSAENGICLCRNHHRLFDAALLEIDLKNNKFYCSSESEKKMEWYKAAQKNKFTLHIK